MVSRVIKNVLFIVLLFGFGNANGQKQPDVSQLMQMYPGEDAVVLGQKQHLVIRNVSDKIDISTNRTSEVLYLSDKAGMYLNQSIKYCDYFTKITDITAATLIPDASGKKMQKFDVKNIYTRNTVMDGIFFDDIKEKYFTYPSLRKGAIAELSYTEEILDPHFLPSFYFGSYVPREYAEFKITHPDDVIVKYMIKDPQGIIVRNDVQSRNTITTTFRTEKWPGHPVEDDAYNSSYYFPHVIAYIDNYTQDGNKVAVLSDINALYSWYRLLYARMKNEISPPLQQLSDSLTRTAKNDEEKIRNVFYWVQNQIRYIAIENGLNGFVPREPIDTYNKKYGDCKDMATLINALLNSAGINAYPTWIGTRDIPYRYNELPTPQSDNHMISAVRFNNEWVFLDGTASHISFGMPTSMIQGKEALIGLSKDSFEVAVVPELPADKSIFKQTLQIKWENGQIKGSGEDSITGFLKESLHETLSHTGQDKQTEFLKKSLNLGNGKYVTDKLELQPDFNNHDAALAYSYTFKLEDYVTEVDDQLLINLNIVKLNAYEKIDVKKRVTDKMIDFKSTEILEVTFEIPQGYHIQNLPSSKNYTDDRFLHTVSYIESDRQVKFQRITRVNTLNVAKTDFHIWNDFVDKLNETGKDLIVLKKSL